MSNGTVTPAVATPLHTFSVIAGALVGGAVVAPVLAPALVAAGLGSLAVVAVPGVMALGGAWLGHMYGTM